MLSSMELNRKRSWFLFPVQILMQKLIKKIFLKNWMELAVYMARSMKFLGNWSKLNENK